MTQKDRVLRSLQQAGPQGMTQVDWLRFPTPDGGAPITRVAARVQELRDEGHPISSSGTRDRCAVYVLKTWVAPVERQPMGADEPAAPAGATLFDPRELSKPLGAYDEYEAA